MGILKLPQQKGQWDVQYQNEYAGDLTETFNVDLGARPGSITLAQKIIGHSTSSVSGLSNIQVPTSFVYTNAFGTAGDAYFAAAEKLYLTHNLSASSSPGYFFLDVKTGTPSLVNSLSQNDTDIDNPWKNSSGYDVMAMGVPGSSFCDIYFFDTTVSTTTWNTAWWTNTVAGNTSPFYGALDNSKYDNGTVNGTKAPIVLKSFNENLLVGSGSFLYLVEKSGGAGGPYVFNNFIFDNRYYVAWIVPTKDKVYVGLWDKVDFTQPSIVAEIDLINQTSRYIDILEGATIGFEWNSLPHVIDLKGFLRAYNGRDFSSILAGFPPAYFKGDSSYANPHINLPHRNGVTVISRRPQIFMPDTLPFVRAGVWVYDEINQSLYHKQAISSSAGAFTYDFGQSKCVTAGAVFAPHGYSETLLLGAEIYNTTTTQEYGVYITNSNDYIYSNYEILPNKGYVVTPKFTSNQIDSFWKRFLLKYNSAPYGPYSYGKVNGQLILKYQTQDVPYYDSLASGGFAVTWTSGTVFTMSSNQYPGGTGDNTSYIGQEVFITYGKAAGSSAHIVSVTGTSTKTITLDESINPYSTPSGSGQSYAMFTNYKKVNFNDAQGPITDATKFYDIADLPETAQSDWIRFKIELRSVLPTNICFTINEFQISMQDNLKLDI